jgi:N12 class adenine-specific DNA methylase
MALYAGWGGLSKVFIYGGGGAPWARSANTDLRDLLTNEEMESARASVLNAHFTAPEICRRIWRTVESLGFSGGAVLEPSAGVGNFLGTMPESLVPHCSITAIEKDDLTGRMLRAIYPDAKVRIGGFEESGDLKGTQDLVISNVPFGNYNVYDPEYHGKNMSIHNYFAVKALDCLKPGGIAAIVTSRYTMDSSGGEHRMMLHDRGRLAGMVRLPSVAHQAQANTQVVTDILFFVRTNGGNRLGDIPVWTQTVETEIVSDSEVVHPACINAYIHKNPLVVIGSPKAVRGMHHEGEYSVEMDRDEYRDIISLDAPFEGVSRPDDVPAAADDSDDEFSTAEANLVSVFREGGSATYYGNGSIIIDEGQPMVVASVSRDSDGVILRVQPFGYATEDERIAAIGFASLMQAYKEVVRAQIDGDPEDVRARARAQLEATYDRFVAESGYIGSAANTRLLRSDPEFQKIAALEIHDKKKKTVTKAAAFFVDTIAPTLVLPERVDSTEDALIHSINHAGRVDLTLMARITGKPESDVEDELVTNGLAYRNPFTNDMELAALYLSGNVREKLAQARVAAESDLSFQDNVSALEAVIPKDIPFDQIGSDIGQDWIPTDIIREFIMRKALLIHYMPIENIKIEYVQDTGEWSVDWDKQTEKAFRISPYQVDKVSIKKMLNMAMNGQSPKIMKTVDKVKVIDYDATAEALEVMSKLKADFNEHLWSDAWRETAVRAYNDRHNNYVSPRFDGSGLHLHGMAADFVMRPHQKNAVLRAMMTGRSLFAHDVGAGKTAVQIATAMQAKIFGSSSRPMIVVPNSMLEQFSREAQQLYPTARILAISKDDLSKEKLKAFMGRAANNDWDLVITTHNSFRRIMLPREYEVRYTNEEISRCRAALSTGGLAEESSVQRRRIKQIEARIARLEARLEYMNAAAKSGAIEGVSMDTIGIDMVIVDESHNFKNLEIPSTEKFAQGISGSARAWDLHNKIRYINEKRGNQTGVYFSSATPVSNNILELYNIQRYLQPDQLEREGLATPEAWARLYLKEVAMWEPDPGGSGWRRNSRYTLRNAPELIRSLHQVMDVVHAEDIGLVRPDAKRQNVVLEMTDQELDIMELLAERTVAIRKGLVKPWEDNMLAVVTAGRKLALDPRLLLRAPDDEEEEISADRCSSKGAPVRDESDDEEGSEESVDLTDEAIACITQNADAIDEMTVDMAQECDLKAEAIGIVAAEIYRRTNDVKGAQLIFCDYGTPGKDKTFVVYDEIRKELVRNGIPDHEIAYAQTPKNDKEKAVLFEAVRNGDVRILIGSTAKMGEGLNVQKRLAALHHLDPPWRPSDIEQREGRAIRFANMFKNVDLITYTKKGSFDEFMWATLKRKYDQFRQILRGDGTIREFDSEVNPTYAETLALTTGNALLKDRLELEQEVDYLSGLERRYHERLDENRLLTGRIKREIGLLKDALRANSILPDLYEQDLRKQWLVAEHVVRGVRPDQSAESSDDDEIESSPETEGRRTDWSAGSQDRKDGEQLDLIGGGVSAPADEEIADMDGEPKKSKVSDGVGKSREWVIRLMADLRKKSDIKVGKGHEVSVTGIWCGGVPINGVLNAEYVELKGRRKSTEIIYRWRWSVATDEVDVSFDRLADMEDYLKRETGPQAAKSIRSRIADKEGEIASIAPPVFEHKERLIEAKSKLKEVIRKIEGSAADYEKGSAVEIDGDDDDDDAQAVGY